MKLQELKQLQQLPLEEKIKYSLDKIRQFYEFFDGQVYISFSGGKDSMVLLHLVRSLYPEVEAVFIDTGLEYPEIRQFVKTVENVKWIKPKKSFVQVITEEGYPVISKMVARRVRDLKNPKNTNINIRRLYFEGIKSDGTKGSYLSKLPKKWLFLIEAPFKISERCCDILKKNIVKQYEKETSKRAYLGMMATDSIQREQVILKYGCNNFKRIGRETSNPLSIWTEENIWEYIKKFNISYCSIYNYVKRTGCIFCMFGIQKDKCLRFKVLRQLHPDLYRYCMEKLGLRGVLKYINDRVDIGYNDLINTQSEIGNFIIEEK